MVVFVVVFFDFLLLEIEVFNGIVLCLNIDLFLDVGDFVVYEWFIGENMVIINLMELGDYVVIVMDEEGCIVMVIIMIGICGKGW